MKTAIRTLLGIGICSAAAYGVFFVSLNLFCQYDGYSRPSATAEKTYQIAGDVMGLYLVGPLWTERFVHRWASERWGERADAVVIRRIQIITAAWSLVYGTVIYAIIYTVFVLLVKLGRRIRVGFSNKA